MPATRTRSACACPRRDFRHFPWFGQCGWLLVVVVGSTMGGTSVAHAQVFRCTVDGRVVYADRPCGSNAIPIATDPGPAAPPATTPNLQHEARLGRLAVGMSVRQVEQAWGKPATTTLAQDASGTSEQWSYVRGTETTNVHFQSGKVIRITTQRLTSPPAAAPAAAAARQLTLSELEVRERSDKAAERRHLREGMTQEEVRGKLGPPAERRFRPTSWGTGDCWTYPATTLDPQTRTVLCFSPDDTRLVTIDRSVQR